MTEFAMGPSVAPALHLVALQHLKRGPALYDSQDDRNGRYAMVEENMTCMTNLADSGGCHWPPVSARHWMKHSAEKVSANTTQSNDNGLQELYCAVAQQPGVSPRNEPKSDWSDESKSGDADDHFLNGARDEEFTQSADRHVDHFLNGARDEEFTQSADRHVKCESAICHDDSPVAEKRRFSNRDRHKDNYDQRSPDCNQSNLKPQSEKLGWRSVGRHAENRRKRWAQADPLLDFWKAVSASRYAAPFRRPVALLDDYETIVRQPMDLSTIRRQLENDESYSLESLRRDLVLMVTNALVYNKKGTETYDMALKLKSHVMRLVEGHQKDTNCPTSKSSPVGNAIKPAAKVTKAKNALQGAMDHSSGADSLPLALIKKHRTMRKPRACISNDGNGVRSDVASGAAMDSSSEEEAAAVLICFSSGQSGDDKQALSSSKLTLSQSPRKRLKRVEVEADDTSACSVTQREALSSGRDQFLARSDVSIMSAGPSPAPSILGADTRPMAREPKKDVYMVAMVASQTNKTEKLGVPVNSKQAPLGPVTSPVGEESCYGSGKSERTCMGLKHKWQARWRMQSAASSETSGSLQQSIEPTASKPCGDKYAMDGGSGAETNFRPFPQDDIHFYIERACHVFTPIQPINQSADSTNKSVR